MSSSSGGTGGASPAEAYRPARDEIGASLVKYVLLALIAAAVAAAYWRPFKDMVGTWLLADSYYTHGFLVPPISLFLIWKRRALLARLPKQPDSWGYPLLAAAAVLLFAGAFWGFRVFEQISLLPLLTGISLLFLGRPATKAIWFPLAFLVFMIPIPPSITRVAAFELKIIATEWAVLLTRLFGLEIVREGSYLHFHGDSLLVGQVCGGLRSLIALLALGALFAYLSKTKLWARLVVLGAAVPIAVITNVLRIFALCVVGYVWGSAAAAGTVHDVSGIMIFVAAFACFAGLDKALRKAAPQAEKGAS